MASRSRSRSRSRRRSAPAAVSLDKVSILNMKPAQARAAARQVTFQTLYRKGKMGLYLFALLLLVASQPADAINWGAYGAAQKGELKPAAKRQAAGAAGKVAQQASVAWVAYFTRSGTAATATALFAVWQENYGKFLLTLALIAYMVREYMHFKIRRGNQNLARLALQGQAHTVERLVAAIERGQNPTLASIARPALAWTPAKSSSPARSRTLRMGAGRPVPSLPRMPTNTELLARLK